MGYILSGIGHSSPGAQVRRLRSLRSPTVIVVSGPCLNCTSIGRGPVRLALAAGRAAITPDPVYMCTRWMYLTCQVS